MKMSLRKYLYIVFNNNLDAYREQILLKYIGKREEMRNVRNDIDFQTMRQRNNRIRYSIASYFWDYCFQQNTWWWKRTRGMYYSDIHAQINSKVANRETDKKIPFYLLGAGLAWFVLTDFMKFANKEPVHTQGTNHIEQTSQDTLDDYNY